MYNKLKSFQASRKGGKTQSTWRTRFRFSVKQKDREKSLQMVDRWNKKLRDLASKLDRVTVVDHSHQKRALPPFGRIRQLVTYLYDALASHWACICTQQRSAKFLLQSHCESAKTYDGDVTFQVLFSRQLVPVPVGAERKWLEGRVIMRAAAS
jgi:hypothetical protein